MPSEFARHWTLDPGITFLNHGSFGATPRPVLDAQAAWRERMEREPVAFFTRELEPALDRARAALGTFIGADPDDLAFVPNATTGVSTVARSLELRAGDEILTTDHAYNAVRNALDAVVARAGARVVVAALPFPGSSPEAATDRILAAVTPRTRLAVIDHVTSTTALVLPIEAIVRALSERGVDALVDGAHAPGMLELDLSSLGAAYYTGNGHKWLCAPKGSGFLHVRHDLHPRVRPLAISHGANSPRTDRSRFRLEHDWTGTADPSAFLSMPAAIDFGAGLMDGGWPALRERNRDVALRGRNLLCSVLGIDAPAPDTMVSGMATVALPLEPGLAPVDDGRSDDALHAALEAQGIQVMVAPWPMRPEGGPWRRVIRISAAAHVASEDLERLARALPATLASVAD
ncbi:MAG TPA: aminotransferase class V-fold PLP-dependent enzyme [Candidatus Limnocylindrales bacterium]|nr:aminotransferase class V-fold PLP-dependent enzyme [Candidatus Limnocylindrales bacterium]